MIERLQQRVISKRLWAWAGATVLLVAGFVDQTAWVTVTVAFMGAEGIQRAAQAYAGSR